MSKVNTFLLLFSAHSYGAGSSTNFKNLNGGGMTKSFCILRLCSECGQSIKSGEGQDGLAQQNERLEVMEIVLETVEMPSLARGPSGSKYDPYVKALAGAAMGQGKSRISVAEFAGIKAAVKRHNDAHPENPIFLSSRTVESDGAGDAAFVAFVRVPFIAGKKRGRKARNTDDAPKVGEIMPD